MGRERQGGMAVGAMAGGISVRSWPALVERVLAEANRPRSEDHGDRHWRAVAAAGRMLCERVPGSDREAVMLFALLHDTRRENEYSDPGHGPRAAAYLRRLVADGAVRGAADDIDRLAHAIARHADGLLDDDPTVGVCWDADRLNLWRVGIRPEPARLCTGAARGRELILWAQGLHETAPTWEEVLAPGFDPRSVGGEDPEWDLRWGDQGNDDDWPRGMRP